MNYMVSNMIKSAKEYMNTVIEILQSKYNMTEFEAYKAVRASFCMTHCYIIQMKPYMMILKRMQILYMKIMRIICNELCLL